MSITVDLGRDLEDFVAKVVESGVYPTQEAVVRDAVRLVQDREIRRAEIDESIDRGLADVRVGRVESADEVRVHLRATFETLATPARA